VRALGIDSGLDGALVVLEQDPSGVISVAFSAVAPTVSVKGGRRYDVGAIWTTIETEAPSLAFACLEDGGVRPGEGVVGAKTVGWGMGLYEMALRANTVPYELPKPQTWQKLAYVGVPGDGKERSIIACDRLLPGLNLRPGRKVKRRAGGRGGPRRRQRLVGGKRGGHSPAGAGLQKHFQGGQGRFADRRGRPG
jgi:hypothetical protein